MDKKSKITLGTANVITILQAAIMTAILFVSILNVGGLKKQT